MSLDFYLEIEVDTGAPEPHKVELYSGNITHNLNKMAEEAGIYKCLWHPYELYENPTAGMLVPHLEAGLLKLKSHPEIRGVRNSRAYIYRIGINFASNERRRRNRILPDEEASFVELPDPAPDPELAHGRPDSGVGPGARANLQALDWRFWQLSRMSHLEAAGRLSSYKPTFGGGAKQQNSPLTLR